MDYLAPAKLYHKQKVEPYKGTAVSASPSEIQELEAATGSPLPDAYREYLLWMGNDTYGIFQGSSCHIRDVIRNTETLKELLNENNAIKIFFQRTVSSSTHTKGTWLHGLFCRQ